MVLDPHRLDLLLQRVRREVENGRLPSAQVAVARHGRLVAAETWGAGAPRYLLQSVGRTIVASAAWKLIGEGRLDVAERVGEIVPEFATHGKDAVTVEHVLTHTAGFPFAPLGYPKMAHREQRLAAFGRWRLDDVPGRTFQFHLTSAAWLIAEIVERRTGMPLPEYLRTAIAEPLGLGFALGVPVEEQAATVAPMVCTDGDGTDVDPWGPWYLADPRVVAAGEPAHAVVASAADVALHYQALLHSPVWAPGAVAGAVRPRLTAVPAGDATYGGGGSTRTSMGLFVVVAGPDAGSSMPSAGSPATFGHAGAAYQTAFCDPVSGMSFAMLSNGYPRSGYDRSPSGVAMMADISDLACSIIR